MTSLKVMLTSAAGEVTLYLAFASPSFLPPRSPGPASRFPWSRPEPAIGPAPDPLWVGRRHAWGLDPCPRTARASARRDTARRSSGRCLRGRRPHTPSTRSGGRRGLALVLITD